MVRTLAALLAATLIISGCQAQAPSGAVAPSGPTGTVIIALGSLLVDNLNPVFATQVDKQYNGGLYNFLIGVTPDGMPSKDTGVLKDWSRDAAGQVWTLTLRPGVKWHDGTEMTSADVKFTFEQYMIKESICSSCSILKTAVDRVEVVDTSTAKLFLKTPMPTFDRFLMPMNDDIVVLPKAYYEKVGAKGFSASPIGSGPFKFADHKIGESITLEANTEYWNRSRIAGFKTVKFVLVPDATSRLAVLQRGEADLADMDPLLAGEVTKANLRLMGPKDVQTLYLAFGHAYRKDFSTNKLEMRKAVALAIDMDAVIKAVYPPGLARRAASWSPTPLREGYIADLKPYPADMAEAQRLVRSAGLTGSEITLYQYTQPGMLEAPKLLEAMAGYLQTAGLKPKFVPVPDYATLRPNLLKDVIDQPYMHVGFAQSGAPLESVNRTFLTSPKIGGLFAGYHDPGQIDALATNLASTADQSARDAIAQQIVRTVYDTYGIVPIATLNAAWAVGPKIAEWQPTSNTFLDLHWETLKPKR